MDRRVAITGLGVVTSLGHDIDEYWKHLVNGDSGIGRITSFDPSDSRCQIGALGVSLIFEVRDVIEVFDLRPDLTT